MKVVFSFALVICSVAGYWEKVDTTADEILEVTRFATETLNELFRSRYHYKLVDVCEARREVAAGKTYKVKISLRETSCLKADKTYEQAKTCNFKDGSFLKYCTVTVLDKPWLKNKELTSHSCSSKPFG